MYFFFVRHALRNHYSRCSLGVYSIFPPVVFYLDIKKISVRFWHGMKSHSKNLDICESECLKRWKHDQRWLFCSILECILFCQRLILLWECSYHTSLLRGHYHLVIHHRYSSIFSEDIDGLPSVWDDLTLTLPPQAVHPGRAGRADGPCRGQGIRGDCRRETDYGGWMDWEWWSSVPWYLLESYYR